MSAAQEVDALTDQAQGLMLVVQLSQPDPNLRSSMLTLWSKTLAAIPWAPKNLPTLAATLFDKYQYLAYPNQNPDGPPDILTVDASRPGQWKQLYTTAWQPFVKQALAGQMAVAVAEGAKAAANTAMWNAIAKYSGADAVEKVWDDLWKAVSSFRAQQDATKLTLQKAQEALNRMGSAAPANLLAAQNDLQTKTAQLLASARSAIAPLGTDALSRAGLGIAPLIIAGIAAAAILTITASIWALAHEMAAVQEQANSHAQEVWKVTDAYDKDQLAKGLITQAEYTRRRTVLAKDVDAVAKARGAAAVGSAVGSAGIGLGVGVGVVALVALVGLYLWKKKSGAAKT